MSTRHTVRVAGMVHVPRALLALAEIEADAAALSCPAPAYVAALRNEDPRAPFLEKAITTLVVGDDVVSYPINAPEIYRRRLRGKAYELVDERPTFESEPYDYRGTLEPFQEEMVTTLAARPNGVGVAACGTGKTEIGIALLGRLGLPSLVLVSQIDHAVDWRDRIHARLGVTAGLIGAGECEPRRITVAIMQSLDADRVASIRSTFGVVLRDEVQHAASETDRRVLGAVAARRAYGLTATPMREDGLWPLVGHHIGPVVYRVTSEQLAGRRVDPLFETVNTSFAFEYRDRTQWAALQTALADDASRNALVIDVAVRECQSGEVGAIITGRVAHAQALHEMLAARGLRSCVLTGSTPKRERASLIEQARAGSFDVIVGTSILDEGINIEKLSRVLLVWPAKAEGRLVQRVGRALRVSPGKSQPKIFDFVDRVGVLRNQARKRAAIFARTWPTSTDRSAA